MLANRIDARYENDYSLNLDFETLYNKSTHNLFKYKKYEMKFETPAVCDEAAPAATGHVHDDL